MIDCQPELCNDRNGEYQRKNQSCPQNLLYTGRKGTQKNGYCDGENGVA